MDFLTSDSFVTIVSVVGSAVGLFLAVGRRIDRVEEGLGARIDRVEEGLGERIDRVEGRIDRVEESLGERIDRLEQDLGARIDRVEGRLGKRIDRIEDRLKELGEQIGELKTAVSVLDAKLDERSVPQRLAVQELPADYSVGDEPESG